LAFSAIGQMLLGGAACATEPSTFLGFRLLNLENQTVKWSTPAFGRSAGLTYAFAQAAVETPGARNCSSMQPPERAYAPSNITASQFRAEVAAAFRMWEKAADVSFRYTDDAATADIIIGAQTQPIGRAFTNVELKPGPAGETASDKKVIARSLICLNPKQPWKIGFDGRLGVYDLRYTIAHEIGHAIGLDHPSAAGQLMSYRYDEKQLGLQPGDIEGAALLYGARADTRRIAEVPVDTAGAPAPESGNAWPFGIGTKQPAPSQALASPEATGSINPRR